MWFFLLSAGLARASDVDVRLGVGLLDLAQLYVGVAPTPAWEVHGTLGTNFGLLTYFTAGVGGIWRPHEWGGGGPNHFSIGVGPDLLVGPAPNLAAVIVSATVDVRYAWRPVDGNVGFVVASRGSLGLTTDLPYEGGTVDRLEPALTFQVIQLGVTFGGPGGL